MDNRPIAEGIFVIGEIHHGRILSLTLEVLDLALNLGRQMAMPVSVLLAGEPTDASIDYLSRTGCDEIICLTHPLLSNGDLEKIMRAFYGTLQHSACRPSVVLTGASAFGRILASRLAYVLGTELLADANQIQFDREKKAVIAQKAASDGKMMHQYQLDQKPAMVSFRQGIGQKAKSTQGMPCHIIKNEMPWFEMAVPYHDDQNVVITKTVHPVKDEEPIEEARMIIAGGRGIKDSSGFDKLNTLASLLGGQSGCTRPCVDAGLMPVCRQIGQSGKTVHPKIYLAFGISGAIQHMMGIQTDTLIAVNTNPKAAIFGYCDYGFVGDAETMIDRLLYGLVSTESTKNEHIFCE